MHELGLALEIAHIASAHAEGRPVRRVVVEIGKLALVVPDALRFAWAVATEDTRLAGAELEVVEVAGRARCNACGCEIAIESFLVRCPCGSLDTACLSGEELRVLEMEVA
jgi:hydrogenase nickel incorporation protein HypA/HybF